MYSYRETRYHRRIILTRVRGAYMTPDEFTASLARLGWKQADFARMADVDKNTPSRWVNGQSPIPGWAARFLEMAEHIKQLAALIEPPKA